MASNREAFQQFMTAGDDAAWDKNWSEAIEYYSRAIHEFPEDPEAHSRLGLCLLEAGRLDDSLKVFTRAHSLAPDDPAPLAKSAEVLEKLGRLKEAAQQYVYVADLYFQQRDLRTAIANWEQATNLTPGLVSIHAKLAQAYERIGDKNMAIRE
jgi:tetratricopeptide (TPR) repeat protein